MSSVIENKYCFGVTLVNQSFDEIVNKTLSELKKEGFGALTDTDIAAVMKAKLNLSDHLPYRIIGACNPKMAHRAMEVEPDIGILLPCNVVVRQVSENVVAVTFKDPIAMFSMVDLTGDKASLSSEANSAKESLLRVRDALLL